MKHLRKFNEAYGDECSFEDFKDIMLDILDDFNFNYDFKDYSVGTSTDFYDCWIYLTGKEEYKIHDDVPSMNINFLGFREDQTLPPTDDPEGITNDGINDCVTSINDNIDSLEELKNNLDGIIKYQKDCSKLFESIKTINKRLLGFSNCEHCAIGFNEGELRITFEIKDENEED